MDNKKRLVFMGSPTFAVPALKALYESEDYEILEVISRPDFLDRRKRKKPQPVKAKALELGLTVSTPEKINDSKVIEHLKSLQPDLFIVAAYGQILGEELLNIPQYGSLNIHGSLLPKFRGAAPVHRAIIEGEDESGVSIMLLDTGMDTGDVLATETVAIDNHTISGEYYDKLSETGAELLVDTLPDYLSGKLIPKKQDELIKEMGIEASYAEKVDKKTSRIDWNLPAQQVLRLINGCDPSPKARTTLIDGEKEVVINLFSPEIVTDQSDKQPGTILSADKENGLIIKCKEDALKINEIQIPGKKRMEINAFFLGHSLEGILK